MRNLELAAQAEAQFFQIRPANFGWIVLKENGDFIIGNISFGQSCSFGDCMIGKVKFNKKSGEGKKIIFDNPDGTREVIKYENGKWFRLMQEGIVYH